MVFTAGVVGWNENERFESDALADQFRQALINTKAILKEADAEPAHIVRMTCYVASCDDYSESIKDIGAAWNEIFGKVFPCMAIVEVSRFVESAALVEIETTAIVPRA